MNPEPLPLTLLAAAAWTCAATFGLFLVGDVAALASPSDLDIVGGVACQAIAYLTVLWLMLQVHAPTQRLGDALALRPVSLAIVLLAILIGVTLQPPMSALVGAIEARWPPPDAAIEAQTRLLWGASLVRKIGMVGAVAVAGPLVEELFFRGGLATGLARAHPRAGRATLVAVALLFALVHLEPRWLLPIGLVGLVIGWLRQVTGSVWPGFALHAAFNGVNALQAAVASNREALARDLAAGDEVSPPFALGGALVAVALLGLATWLAARSADAIAGRRADAG